MRALLVLALLVLVAACDVATPDADASARSAELVASKSRTLAVPAAAFAVDGGWGRLQQDGTLATAAAAVAYGPIPLGAGAVLDAVRIVYIVGGAGGAYVQPAVRCMDVEAADVTTLWIGAPDAAGSVPESQVAVLGATVAPGAACWAELGMTGGPNRLIGAVVDYHEGAP